jgi:hypothetical protein
LHTTLKVIQYYNSNVLQVFYKCVLQVFYKCFTSVLQVFYKCFTSVLQVFYKCFTSVFYKCFTSVVNFVECKPRRIEGDHLVSFDSFQNVDRRSDPAEIDLGQML